MSSFCTITPQIKSPSGNIVDSNLFKDLRKHLSYENAREVYLRTKNTHFNEVFGDSIDFDENGEPTYTSIRRLSVFSDIINNETIYDDAKKQVQSDKSYKATRENINKIEDKVIAYNSSEDSDSLFIADIEFFIDEDGVEKVHAVIIPNTEVNRERVSELSRKRTLNRKLESMLKELGVGIGTLNELEEKLRVRGVTDFEAAQLTASGMVEMIRLAKDKSGDEALPEEFSHLILEALKDNPIVSRLHDIIADNNLESAILDDDFDTYSTMYKNDKESLIKEAMGTIVARHILAQVGIGNENTQGYENASGIIGRLINAFKGKFSQEDEYKYLEALKEAEQVAGEFAYAIMNNGLHRYANLENVTSSQKFYQLSQEVDKKKKLLNMLCENTAKRYAILESREKTKDDDARTRLQKIVEKFNMSLYEEGIYEFIDSAMSELESLEPKIDEIREHPEIPFNTRAFRLKNAKDYITSYKLGVEAIENAIARGVIEPNEERSATINALNKMVKKVENKYIDIADDAFVEFIKEFVGEGIEIPYGKMKGKIFKAEDIAKLGDHDIGFFDRWLDSMANSSDFVLRMLDSKAKTAKGKARIKTLEYKERIDAADRKLKKAGINDTDFMFMKVDGKKTFNYISEEDAQRLPLPQRTYYTEMMKIKKELDSMLPEGTTKTRNIVVVRKDLLHRLKLHTTPKGILNETLESIRDSFYKNSDDTEYGEQVSKKKILQDFEGNRVDMLPIYYIKPRPNEKAENISDDVSSTMVLYAQMCNNYQQMHNTIGTLEFVRDRMRNREVQVNENGKPLHSVFTALGMDVSSNYTKKGEATNIVQRMNNWFSSQVYGKYMNEGEILGMSTGKIADNINSMTALNTFACNILSGLSNVMTGTAMMRIEGISGQFFNMKNTTNADAIFTKELMGYLADVGNPVKSSKLALFDEMFNVMQEYESDMMDVGYRKNRVQNAISMNSLYLLNNAGELWMQNRTALALADAYKLKDGDKTITLWEALETKTVNGVTKLVVKPGVTKMDGNEFTDPDIIAFTNRAKAINQRMHGIYNYEDRNAWQATAVGKMALMFRKWIRPNLQMKFGTLKYNYDLQAWEEGYWRTAGRFLNQLTSDLKLGKFEIMTTLREMTPEEKANMKKVYMEVGQFLLCVLAFSLLKSYGDDDDDEGFNDTWFYNQMLYQTRRLRTELGATMPGPSLPAEALTIIKSPAAGISTIEDLLNMRKLLNPYNYTDDSRLQTGRYKGRTAAHKYFMESPFVPIYTTIYRGTHPKESLNYFTQND